MSDSHILDLENKKEIESMTTSCLDQLTSIQEKHGGSISNIRSQAEKCLTKDYMVHILNRVDEEHVHISLYLYF